MTGNDSRKERLDRVSCKAAETLLLSGNCAQTSFIVLRNEFALGDGNVLKALTPFPGLGLRGETCGAVTGCLMALGLVFGRERLDDWETFTLSLKHARNFCRSFIEQNGSTACAKILESRLGQSFDLADSAGWNEYIAAGGPGVCGELVAGAVKLAAEIIMDHG